MSNHPTKKSYSVGRPASSRSVSPDLISASFSVSTRLVALRDGLTDRQIEVARLQLFECDVGLSDETEDQILRRWGASAGAWGKSPKAEPSVTGDAKATGEDIGERSGERLRR